ncbi:hypothetical protein SLA2020_409600 [Shorea laevis]
MATTTKVSLKLFTDKKSRRVLFAEANKEFVDFLFSIFTLPVGAVTRLLKEAGGGMAGCLPSLYQSIENMSFNVNDIEEKMVDLGMDEGVKLLRASLQSRTVLTDVLFLGARAL